MAEAMTASQGCPKCGGYLMVEREVDGDTIKCLNCGLRGDPMPRFKSEATRQRWREAMAKRRGRPRNEKTAESSADPLVRTASGGQGAIDAALTAAIDSIEAKLSELTACRTALLKSRESLGGRS